MSLQRITELALACGFELAGIASALPSPDFTRYRTWVDNGMAGKMTYLTDHRAELRADPRSLLPSAKSIVCVGKLYNRPDPPVSSARASEGFVSRYAGGTDYHQIMSRDLERLVSVLQEAFGDFEYKICTDTAPLLERTYARLAGLGWIGKNSCLINEGQGSWFFLGEILTSLELAPSSPPPDRCGTCTRCIDACPTFAIVPTSNGETVLDARRCISYLTIELKGNIPEQFRGQIGSHLFGCDICQDVCPWNRKAPVTEDAAYLEGSLFHDLEQLAAMTEEEFKHSFQNSPIWRKRYTGFLRNVCVAMGNSGQTRFAAALSRLSASTDPDVATHAAWALRQLEMEGVTE